jgi:hypothetical protein
MGRVMQGPWAKREAKSKLFAALAAELSQMPSPKQETLICQLIEETGDLAARLGEARPMDRPAWLRGFIKQVDADLWPPVDGKDWQRVIGALKAKKTQHQAVLRKRHSITPKQIKAVWALVRRHPHVDSDLLYQIIGTEFPNAKKGKGKQARPSLSSLTQGEAGRLLDMLREGQKRRRA